MPCAYCGGQHGAKSRADDPVQLFPDEEPQYEALARAVESAWRVTRRGFRAMRAEWYQIAGLEDGKRLSAADRRALDAATERFLREFAGADRTRLGFVDEDEEDGTLQQLETLATAVGSRRAEAQVGRAAPNPAHLAGQRRQIMERAFERLSADGVLRFESRLGEIRDGLIAALNAGESPLVVARRVGADLDGYERGRLRTIVRTEAAFAAEQATVGTYRALGVQRYRVIGDSNTDELCTSRIGNTYDLGDDDNLPPYHPNCFCDVSPVLPDDSD